ncbi:MAG: HEAT repeat domain-containing protein [Planctomycetaceae bacterium]|jgi:HEAT repeat protein|nr:HEAT repeat domain-containing protein [Planctomycetaceae bacterium]
MKRCVLFLAVLFTVGSLSAQNTAETAKQLQTLPNNGGANEDFCLQVLKRTGDDNDTLFLKILACKQLGKYGTKAAVPVLLPLFDAGEQGFYVRYALETLPGTDVDAEVCKYIKDIKSPVALAGTLTTLGVRANPDSAAAAKEYLANENPDVRKAAAYAYARCGGDAAIGFFVNPKIDPEQADSGFLLAENFLRQNEKAKALTVYDALAAADIRPYQKESAVLQTILVRGADGIGQLVKQLRSSSPKEFAVGLRAGREMTGGEAVVKALSQQITAETDLFRKSLIVRALGGRKDTESVAAALPVLAVLAKSGDESVRIAAIDSLGTNKSISALPVLLFAAMQQTDAGVAAAAKKALINLPGQNVDAAIVELAESDDALTRASGLQLIEERRIVAAFPLLLRYAGDSNTEVRNAALSALGQVAEADDMPKLLEIFAAAKDQTESAQILETLKSIGTRVAAEKAVQHVETQLAKSSTAQKAVLINLLQEIGGAKALAIVSSYAFGDDAVLKDAATESLGKWSKTDDVNAAAEVCLKLAESQTGKYKDRSLSGAVRIARQFAMPETQRIQICSAAYKLASNDKDKLLVVDVYWRHPSLKMLSELMQYIDEPALTENVCDAAVKLSEKIQEKSPAVKKAMETVLEKAKDNTVKDKARIVLSRQ